MSALASVLYREWALFSSSRSSFLSALIEPVIYVVFFLPGIGQMLSAGQTTYILFALPGIMLIAALSVGVNIGSPVFFDRYTGEMETLFTLPVARDMFFVGRLTSAFLRMAAKSTVTLILASTLYPAVRTLGATKLLALLVAASCVSVVVSCFFIYVASTVKNQGQFNLYMNLLITPLLPTSSAFYPIENLPPWLFQIASFNPLTHLVADLRSITTGAIVSTWTLIMILIIGSISIFIALRCFKRAIS